MWTTHRHGWTSRQPPARVTPTRTLTPAPTTPATTPGLSAPTSPLETSSAKVSAFTVSIRARTAAHSSSGTSRVRSIRSETCSPASLRACWANRSRSLTAPWATNSSSSTVSSDTNPPDLSSPTASDDDPLATSCSEYSPSSRGYPPQTTEPSSATVQSPDFDALITCCTSLPSRGPAARALTDNCRDTLAS